MAESNKMKEMPVNKLMVQMGIPMILSMALQAVYNIVDSAFVGNMRVPHMMEAAGVTEELKACDPMRWVGLMNTLTAQIEEILIRELICS